MRIRIRPSFAAYFLILSLLSGLHASSGLFIALAVHEGCHALTAMLLKEPIESIELAPLGGVMRYKSGTTASKGIKGLMLALSGPLGNYAMIWLASKIGAHCDSQLVIDIIKVNLTMMLLNLFPAFPFDGGMVLFCFGYYVWNVSILISILCMMGFLFGIALFVLACVGVVLYEKLNLSLMIVGAYVLCYARNCKGELLAQNAYAIMSEQAKETSKIKKLILYKAHREEQLCNLIPYICQSNAVAFLVEHKSGKSVLIGGNILSREIMRAPYQPIINLIENKKEAERSEKNL